MKKIAILGCENSHANAFIKCIQTMEEFSQIQVYGVYSDDPAASEKLASTYGVPVLRDYADAVGKVDGVVITARHGDNHLKYAKPYLDSGIPMFIDKPITVTEADAIELMTQLKKRHIPVTGGSSLRHDPLICQLKQQEAQQEDGYTVGGIVRAPLSTDNIYGGFFFYSQHLVEMVCEIFGRNPKSVQVSIDSNKNRTVLFHYDTFTVTGLYTEGGNEYYAARFALNGSQGGLIPATGSNGWYYGEFKEYADVLFGGEQPMSYRDLAAPVFVLNAIHRASISGNIEPVSESGL